MFYFIYRLFVWHLFLIFFSREIRRDSRKSISMEVRSMPMNKRAGRITTLPDKAKKTIIVGAHHTSAACAWGHRWLVGRPLAGLSGRIQLRFKRKVKAGMAGAFVRFSRADLFAIGFVQKVAVRSHNKSLINAYKQLSTDWGGYDKQVSARLKWGLNEYTRIL